MFVWQSIDPRRQLNSPAIRNIVKETDWSRLMWVGKEPEGKSLHEWGAGASKAGVGTEGTFVIGRTPDHSHHTWVSELCTEANQSTLWLDGFLKCGI